VRRGKAKIGFEVDADDLANAKAFVAKHGGSLNKLVSALFASLGREAGLGPPVADPALGLPQPRLPKEFVNQQLNLARDALEACLVHPADAGKKRKVDKRPLRVRTCAHSNAAFRRSLDGAGRACPAPRKIRL
jgi:hypothetical protein